MRHHEKYIAQIIARLEGGGGADITVDHGGMPWQRVLAPRGPQGRDVPEQPTCTAKEAVKRLHDVIAANNVVIAALNQDGGNGATSVSSADSGKCDNQCPEGTTLCRGN